MAVDVHDELPGSTPREVELQRQLDSLQSQVTELQRAQEKAAENPEILSEVQGLKNQLDEHSKRLEQSAEKLNQLEAENISLRDENQILNMVSNKKRRFRIRVRSMSTPEHIIPEETQLISKRRSTKEHPDPRPGKRLRARTRQRCSRRDRRSRVLHDFLPGADVL
ncbi:hypothetical protein Bca4012_020400 [Brassica carinata]